MKAHDRLFPSNIKKIAIISPASRVKAMELEESLAKIRAMGIEVVCGANLNTDGPESYLAGTAEERAADFMESWMDPTVDFILCARGCYGSAQILPFLNWTEICKRHPVIVGYSDITALHLALLKYHAGIPIAGLMAGKIAVAVNGSPESEVSAKWFYHALNRTAEAEYCQTLTQMNAKTAACGLPVAANLTVLVSLLGTPYFPDLSKRILIVEDIGESLYRIDRNLTQLELSGHMNNLAGLIFADFRQEGIPVAGIDRLARRFAAKVPYGVWIDFSFGHIFPSVAINQTREMVIQDNRCEL